MFGSVRCREWANRWTDAGTVAVIGALLLNWGSVARASDHLDTPTVIADSRVDIGDVYAWTSREDRQLNLVMTIVGHTLSDKARYVFHVDSGSQFGKTTASTEIACLFPAPGAAECKLGTVDEARGNPDNVRGLQSRKHRFRVFAGLRDDPFFNNVKGTRAAYKVASTAISNGASVDASGCPHYDSTTSQKILDEWRHTEGGPAKNLLAGWTPFAIVVSVDLTAVSRGGKVLAVWGATTTATGDRQIDRAGRPLTGNALLGLFASDEVSNALKEKYNADTPASAAQFAPEIEKGLAHYDSFDGECGNQLLADQKAASSIRYRTLATLLADDRLWINSQARACTQLFGVELANLAGRAEFSDDCGGRAPNYDASNIYRSLLVNGTTTSVDDGVHHAKLTHSDTVFPFLAAPDTGSAGGK